MKAEHILIGLVTFAFLIPSSAAVVGGPEADDGEMTITSGSSSSASKAVGPNGTEWTTEVSMVNRTSNITQDRLENIEYGAENYTVDFTGYITAPTPCHVIDHEMEETEGGYVMNINTERSSDSQACIEVLTMIKYDADFSTDEQFTLKVRHDNETVRTLEHPGMDSTEPEKKRKGFFSGIMSWLSGLF